MHIKGVHLGSGTLQYTLFQSICSPPTRYRLRPGRHEEVPRERDENKRKTKHDKKTCGGDWRQETIAISIRAQFVEGMDINTDTTLIRKRTIPSFSWWPNHSKQHIPRGAVDKSRLRMIDMFSLWTTPIIHDLDLSTAPRGMRCFE